MLAAFAAGVADKPRAAGACSAGRSRSATRSSRRCAPTRPRTASSSPARARRHGRLGQGPRHRRDRLRPAGAARRARRASTSSRRSSGTGNNAARGAHPHGHRARPARRRARPVRQRHAAPDRLEATTTWRCARWPSAAACTSPSTAILDDATGETHRCATEEEVYALLGLPWIPPELREDRGELRFKSAGDVPVADRAGRPARRPPHAHGPVRRAQHASRRWRSRRATAACEYIAITDHSASHGFGNHVDAGRAAPPDRAHPRARRAPRGDRRSSIGTETNIGTDGRPDYDDDLLAELDWVIGSVHTSFGIGTDAMTDRIVAAIEHPLVDAIGHPTGRKIERRAPYAVDMDRIIEAAARTGTMIEINSAPDRRDLNDVHARAAARAGRADPHQLRRARRRTRWRTRAGASRPRAARGSTAADVANTLPWEEFAPLRKRRAGRGLAQQRAAAARQQPSATVRSTAAWRVRRQRGERALGVAGAGLVERGAQRRGEPAVASAPSRGSSARASGSAAYGPGAGGRDERAAVGQRLELGDPVVLAARRGDEDARAAQQRAVRRSGAQAAGVAHARRRPARARCRRRRAPRPRAGRRPTRRARGRGPSCAGSRRR